MQTNFQFPFGQPVQEVVQTDRSEKQVFVLGVYASAVHARWVDANNKTKVRALAVASEPYIFWRGENATEIIEHIDVPEPLGKLLPASKQLNGPSGIALDEMILDPLGLARSDVWLCDLVPHSCVNSSQYEAIEREYSSLISKYNLPIPSVPSVPNKLTDEKRRDEIYDEIIESMADTLILLGDKPIQWFLNYYDNRWSKLSDFAEEKNLYGQILTSQIKGREINILPIAHPRQIAKLGTHSPKWYEYHQFWVGQIAPTLF